MITGIPCPNFQDDDDKNSTFDEDELFFQKSHQKMLDKTTMAYGNRIELIEQQYEVMIQQLDILYYSKYNEMLLSQEEEICSLKNKWKNALDKTSCLIGKEKKACTISIDKKYSSTLKMMSARHQIEKQTMNDAYEEEKNQIQEELTHLEERIKQQLFIEQAQGEYHLVHQVVQRSDPYEKQQRLIRTVSPCKHYKKHSFISSVTPHKNTTISTPKTI